ncbi:MAG TPA: flavodoxin family protein [Candidatus Wallbacteria bacterium]|nr:MAG: putative NAD(P)H-dependent FMN-containing oxidoreductase YwqN [bacterium ADurb.Bin243]HOD42008.1 flavodoxin family protein [Candidatus Wallbacteria bacterium]HPG58491.1 flavodoxin family protein [Candidatus Wallbacteria bacterium]
MHVLGIVGSPRVNGNTDILVDEILAGVRSSGGTIDKIYISDFDLKPCDSCMACLAGKECVLEDGWREIAPRVLKADGLVMGTPVYWNAVSAQMKIFMDRCFSFLDENYDSEIKGKSAAIVVACGSPEPAMTKISRLILEDFIKFNKMNIVGGVTGLNLQQKDDALKNQALMAEAFQIGRKFI